MYNVPIRSKRSPADIHLSSRGNSDKEVVARGLHAAAFMSAFLAGVVALRIVLLDRRALFPPDL